MSGTASCGSSRLLCGIDVGGTRTKVGLIDPKDPSAVLAMEVFDTERNSEELFLGNIRKSVQRLTDKVGNPSAAGVSIGSYAFRDGSIDGLSSMIRFMTHGYPLATKLSDALCKPVRIDNDARLICLAEAVAGSGRGFSRVLTITLRTGIGIGICQDSKPLGSEPFFHLAGHLKVREGTEFPWLDETPCYCGISGCAESTCSGTALALHVRHELGKGTDVKRMFEMASQGDLKAKAVVDWYITYLLRALNQYVYAYCPDVIVLGGGVAHGLSPYLNRIRAGITSWVFEGQRTEVRLTSLEEEAGVIGAASLFCSDDWRANA